MGTEVVKSIGGVEDTTFETKTKDLKKSKAEAQLHEDRPFLDQGQEWSRPRIKDRIFLNYGRDISKNFLSAQVFKISQFVKFLMIIRK